MDTINFFDSFPYSAIRGYLFFKNNDSYIEYYVKKSNFWNNEGKDFSQAKKEAFVKKAKEYIEILLKKSNHEDNTEITKLIKYKDKVEILFKEEKFFPSVSPSSDILKAFLQQSHKRLDKEERGLT